MPDSSYPGAVFLSYARDDAAAAQRIAEALRIHGVEVWFDQNELRGGDVWDVKIRRQIKDCALFLPVISTHTDARTEGYFRLEWKLAVDRSHLMAEDAAFIVPVVIDGIADGDARVPEKFREVQWTRLAGGETPVEFAERIAMLLTGEAAGNGTRVPTAARKDRTVARRARHPAWRYGISGLAAAAVILVLARPWNRGASRSGSVPASAPALAESRQLLNRALALVEKIDSTIDDFNAAEGLLTRARALDPSDGDIWAGSSYLSTSYFGRGFDLSADRLATGQSEAKQAVTLAPDSALAWLALAYATPHGPASEANYRKALALAPARGWIHFRSMEELATYAKGSERIRLLEQSIDPSVPGSDALAHYIEFGTFFSARRFAEADRMVAASVQELPSANFVCGRVMSLLTWKGDTEGAAAALTLLSPTRETEPRSLFFKVYTALLRRRPQEAMDILASTSAVYVDDNYFSGPTSYFLGLARYENGDLNAARLAWSEGYAQCVRRDADHTPDPYERSGLTEAVLLAWLGREKEARQILSAIDGAGWRESSVRGYAALGDADRAIPRIKQVLGERSHLGWPLTPALLRLDPIWDKLRADPRFVALEKSPPQG